MDVRRDPEKAKGNRRKDERVTYASDLMRLHVEALFTRDHAGRLLTINEPGGATARMTPHAHEAGVETHPEFRGRAHAARAVRAWARAVRELDRIPLYSTSWENKASRALAARLGLLRYEPDLHTT